MQQLQGMDIPFSVPDFLLFCFFLSPSFPVFGSAAFSEFALRRRGGEESAAMEAKSRAHEGRAATCLAAPSRLVV